MVKHAHAQCALHMSHTYKLETEMFKLTHFFLKIGCQWDFPNTEITFEGCCKSSEEEKTQRIEMIRLIEQQVLVLSWLVTLSTSPVRPEHPLIYSVSTLFYWNPAYLICQSRAQTLMIDSKREISTSAFQLSHSLNWSLQRRAIIWNRNSRSLLDKAQKAFNYVDWSISTMLITKRC